MMPSQSPSSRSDPWPDSLPDDATLRLRTEGTGRGDGARPPCAPPPARRRRTGLRSALYWLLGSSIASLLFLRFGFLWTHVFILIGTLSVGAIVMLQSLRAVHRRLGAEKRRELSLLRSAIQKEGEHVLGDGPGAVDAASRLPGLLALEARTERASTWPFDASTFLRFSALGLLAIGSWLGGAVIERLLGLAVD